jgi:peptidyl-tRNA hydrolase
MEQQECKITIETANFSNEFVEERYNKGIKYVALLLKEMYENNKNSKKFKGIDNPV